MRIFQFGVLLLCLSACDALHHDSHPGSVAVQHPELQTAPWNETAVRKVLRVFAYGGQATDAQISTWATLPPAQAIEQMLTFDEVNPLLSPPSDTTAKFGGSLQALQNLWASNDPANPMRPSLRGIFPLLASDASGHRELSATALIYTWVASSNKRGLNPFRQRIGLFLTNYLMAVNTTKVRPPLIRGLYDQLMQSLANDAPFQDILAEGASSAAIAMQYGHNSNTFDNATGSFKGNDDFAREFHQLFFRINGRDFTTDYHENTTIENTARALTGMQIDRDPQAWGGSDAPGDYWLDRIDFGDHVDPMGNHVNNTAQHHGNDLEILGGRIHGNNAREKIFALARAAINLPESLDNLPLYVISSLADDNLSADKISGVRALWAATQPKNLLAFLRAYAISPLFLRADTYKFFNAVDRNILIYNLNTTNNADAYSNGWMPHVLLYQQGGVLFNPAHDVFGGQTGPEAADNADIFKLAYNATVDNYWFIVRYTDKYTENGADFTWNKDWSVLIPRNTAGVFQVQETGEWLWQRFVADDLKNYGPLERAYVESFLATGTDFGAAVDDADPDHTFSAEQLQAEPYASYRRAHAATILNLTSSDQLTRNIANRNVGLAIDFIAATPFMFAAEGN